MGNEICVNVLTFDIAQTAGLYSQLAGVLSGFAFAALVVILTSRLTAEQALLHNDETTRTMVSCFVGLILVSLAYAVLAGETTNSGRAASVELLAAPGFIAAGMLLLLAILALLRTVERLSPDTTNGGSDSIHLVRLLLAHVAPAILAASLYGGVDDYSDARYGSHAFRTIDLVLVICYLFVVVAPVVAYRKRYKYASDTTRKRDVRTLAYAAVGLAACSAIATFLVSASIDKCDALPQWVASLAITIPMLFMLVLSTYLIRSRELSAA